MFIDTIFSIFGSDYNEVHQFVSILNYFEKYLVYNLDCYTILLASSSYLIILDRGYPSDSATDLGFFKAAATFWLNL